MPTAVILLGAVMIALSGGSANVALPVLTAAFKVTPAVIAWVGLGFSLVSAALLTVFGRLADLHGRKRYYALGVLIFGISSALCGLSGSVLVLIVWRAVQGVGGALVNANSVAYLVEIYPGDRRGSIVGWWEAAIAAGQMVGPVLGGLLLAAFGWPAIFVANLPICVLILVLVPRFLVEPPRLAARRSQHRFDLVGACLFAAGLSLLLFGLTNAADSGLDTIATTLPLLSGFAMLCAFVWVELRVPEPMIDLGLFRHAGFSAGNLAKVAAYLGFSASGFLLPFYLYQALGQGPAEVGLSLTIMPVGMLASSLLVGPLSDRIGTRVLAPLGVFLLVLAAVLLALIRPEQGFAMVAVAMALAGIGVGSFIAPNDSAILSVTPPERLGVANGVMGVSRTLGLLLGQAIGGSLLASQLIASHGDFVSSFHQTYLVVGVLTAFGIGLAAVRSSSRPTVRG